MLKCAGADWHRLTPSKVKSALLSFLYMHWSYKELKFHIVCRVAGVLDNHQCFLGEAGDVNVLQGGE